MKVISSETMVGDRWVIDLAHNEVQERSRHYTYGVSAILGVHVDCGATGYGQTEDAAIADAMRDLQEQLECAEHAVEVIKSALAALTARTAARSSSSGPSR